MVPLVPCFRALRGVQNLFQIVPCLVYLPANYPLGPGSQLIKTFPALFAAASLSDPPLDTFLLDPKKG
jgi:hypothetical protein